MKEYQIPIQCFTTVCVTANNLEEAVKSLTHESIPSYEKTFKDWEIDEGSPVCIIDEDGTETEDYVSVEEMIIPESNLIPFGSKVIYNGEAGYVVNSIDEEAVNGMYPNSLNYYIKNAKTGHETFVHHSEVTLEK